MTYDEQANTGTHPRSHHMNNRKTNDEDWAGREDKFDDWVRNGNDIQPDSVR